MEISVRTAAVEDAAAIAAINIASWEATYRGIVNDAFLDRASLAERASRWRERFPMVPARLLVAETPGDGAELGPAVSGREGSPASSPSVVGYCLLALPARDEDSAATTAEICAIYVSPTCLRGGAGSALMGAALELISAASFRTVTLWALTANTPAHAFYARHGFLADGTTKWLTALGAEEIRLRRAM